MVQREEEKKKKKPRQLSAFVFEMLIYSGLFVEIAPALECLFDFPEPKIRDGHLPEREVMQISILALDAHRLLIALNRAPRLAATQAEPPLS